MSLTQWLNMARRAGFDVQHDTQIENMFKDGARLKWGREQYNYQNSTQPQNQMKLPITGLDMLQGFEEEWCKDLWGDASIGARLFGSYSRNINEIPDAFFTQVFRVPKMLPDRTMSTKGRFVQNLKPIKAATIKSQYKKPNLPTFQDIAKDIVVKNSEWESLQEESGEKTVTHCRIMKADIDNAFKRINLNPLDTGATVTAALVCRKGDTRKQVMTATRGMAFGLQAAPGIFSYFSEIITAGLRDVGITAQTFVDDIVIIEKPDPQSFFQITNDEGTIANLLDPAFGNLIGHKIVHGMQGSATRPLHPMH